MRTPLLLLPGPMQVPDFVLAASTRPMFSHRSPEMLDLFARIEVRCRSLFGTRHDVLFHASSGTGAMESAIVNLTSPAEEVLVVSGGVFAQRWSQIANAYGLNVRVLEVDWRKGACVADVEQGLQQWPGARIVFITWSESSTGVLIELEKIGRLVRSQNKYLVVDAVSGLGVSPLKMDDWMIDTVIVGSQKGLMLPPGLGIVAVGARAWEKHAASNTPRFYWEWENYRNAVSFTPATTLLFQLDASLEYIHAQGIDRVFARRAYVAATIRTLVESVGMEVYALNPGNGITAVVPAKGFDISLLETRLERDFAIQIAGGLGILKDKIFRIGHVGHLPDEELDYFLQSFRKCLN